MGDATREKDDGSLRSLRRKGDERKKGEGREEGGIER